MKKEIMEQIKEMLGVSAVIAGVTAATIATAAIVLSGCTQSPQVSNGDEANLAIAVSSIQRK